MSKKLLYLMSFVLVLAVTGTASADTWDITVPDAGFEDHVLGLSGYVYIDDRQYDGAWECDNWAWVTYMYYPDALPALSPNNKVYCEDDIIYQILDERFIEGGTYTLSVWAGEAWTGYSHTCHLYFTGEDYTNNLIEASRDTSVGNLITDWGQVSLAYTATAADAGTKFGIKLKGDDWVAFDDVTLSYDGPPGNVRATNPIPADGSEYDDDEVDLYWIPGYLAVEHDVYFGTAFNDVNDANTTVDPCNVYQGRQPDDFYPVWDDLVPGTTYYWRIDEVNDAEPGSPWKGKVWSFWLRPWEPQNPSPHDGAIYQDPNVDLSWSAGFIIDNQQVFFGTDPGSMVASSKFPESTYDPGPLDSNTTYYWQVKEYQPRGRTTLGPIWSFTTTLPTMGTILYEYWDGITPTGQSLSLLYNWPDFPGNPTGTMEFSRFEGPTNRANQFGARMQAWLYPPVTGDYKFWIATDDNGDLNLSTDDNPFNKQRISWVRPWAASRDWGDPDITPSGLIPLEAGEKYYIEGLMKEAGGGDNIAVGWTTPLDDTIQVIPGNYLEKFVQWWAWDPSPADGDPEADRPTMLRWRAGSHAAQHQVYLGTSEVSMTLQDTLPLGTEEYDPGTLVPGQTYYWKVTEVNSIEPGSPWEGDVWNFTTALCITLEDMEDYNDRGEIRGVWTDGYASVGWGGTYPLNYPLNAASSGSNLHVSTEVGSPSGSAGPVHGGDQAMVLRYDNDGSTDTGIPGEEKWIYDAANFSEVEANTVENLGVSQDWTVEDVKFLSMWFQGHPITDGNWASVATWPELAVTGRGRDIWGSHDEFYFIGLYPWEPGISASYVEGRVVAMDNTHTWAKAGIMVREKMTPFSRFAAVYITPGQGVSFQWRDVEGGPAGRAVETPSVTAPVYLKLDRTATGAFTASYNLTGESWDWHDVNVTQNPDVTFKDVGMDDPCLYAGFAVTSHNAAALCTADVNNFKANPPDAGKWVWGNVGLNDPEQLYVALQDTMDNISVVKHSDVNAATLASWQEWNIPLADFVGVNLDAVKKVRIGLGDRDVPQSGGSGAIYIDDIRSCPAKCIPALVKPLYDIAQPYDCIVDEKDLMVLAQNWLAVVSIPIDNPGFEDPVLADGVYSGAHVGWGWFAAENLGTWNPGLVSGDIGYGGDAPEGQNVGFTNPNDVGVPGGFAQVLTDADATLKVDTTYTLTVEVGNTLGYSWGGYSVQLLAGGTPGDTGEITVGTLLAEDANSLTIAEDTIETSTVTYTYNPAHSALLGEPLQIRLLCLGGVSADDETDFDNVTFFQSPEPLTGIPRAAERWVDLYEDGAINFKDYSLLANQYLDEILWP